MQESDRCGLLEKEREKDRSLSEVIRTASPFALYEESAVHLMSFEQQKVKKLWHSQLDLEISNCDASLKALEVFQQLQRMTDEATTRALIAWINSLKLQHQSPSLNSSPARKRLAQGSRSISKIQELADGRILAQILQTMRVVIGLVAQPQAYYSSIWQRCSVLSKLGVCRRRCLTDALLAAPVESSVPLLSVRSGLLFVFSTLKTYRDVLRTPITALAPPDLAEIVRADNSAECVAESIKLASLVLALAVQSDRVSLKCSVLLHVFPNFIASLHVQNSEFVARIQDLEEQE